MATLTEYTPKQQTEMNRLAARATRYKMKIDEINRELSQPVISFEKNKELREKLAMYKDLFITTSDEISEIADERRKYEEDIEKAKFYLASAEARNKKYGFEKR